MVGAQGDDRTWIDEMSDRFERAWEAGEHPGIENYVAGTPDPRRSQLLYELLWVERELRLAVNERPTPEEYRHRFPGDAAVINAVFAVDLDVPRARPHVLAKSEGDAGRMEGSRFQGAENQSHPRPDP